MRKTVLGSASAIAIALATGGAAWAADVPMKAAPYAAAPLFNWSGWYFGANFGPATGQIVSDSDSNIARKASRSWTPGLQLGYNVQNGNVVWGIEGDIALTKSKFAWSSANDGSSVKASTASIRGRLGWAFDRILAYGTAGFADVMTKACSSAASTGCLRGSKWKPVVGVGLEGALTNNWILGAEYLWYLGSGKTIDTGDDLVKIKDYQQFRVRLSYKFDGSGWGKGPVSARY
jgi:outer membrane immunogenic protein